MRKKNLSLEQRLKNIEDLLLNCKSVFNLNDAVNYTGLSKSYLYKLTSSNAITHSKPNGKMIFFDKKNLDSWLLRNRVKTIDEERKDASDHLIMGGSKI